MSTTEKLKFCGQQIKRLASKPFFPTAKEGIEELAYTLDTFTKSSEHAKRVVDAAVLSRFGAEGKVDDRCPGPADLRDLCSEVASCAPHGEASPDCQFCEGTGYEDKGNGFDRCRCGGIPMSDQSRTEWSRKTGGQKLNISIEGRKL